jgi:hypothetical protein
VKILSPFVLGALLAACGGGRVIPANTIYDDGDQDTPACQDPPRITPGPGNTGDECESAQEDCGLVCCQCAGDPDTFLASECYEGYCADLHDTCNDACNARN